MTKPSIPPQKRARSPDVLITSGEEEDEPEVMVGGMVDENSNIAFENLMGLQNIESDEEGVKDDSVEDNMEIVLDFLVRKYLHSVWTASAMLETC